MAAPGHSWSTTPRRPIYATLTRVATESNWFEVYEVRDGVFAIYEPFQFEEVISYLIVGEARALLFDTGLGVGSISDVVARLTPLPVSVLNSHTHFDHIGGNAEFEDILGLDTAFSRASAQGLPNAEVRDVLAQEALRAELPSGVDAATYRIRGYEALRFVDHGARIELGGRTLEVIATPGHTPDSLMLLDRAHGLLFTGDSFYEGPIYLFAPETDWRSYRRSMDQVAQLVPELTLLLPAHNTPAADPALLLDLAEALEAIESGKAQGASRQGRIEYDFERFSILARP